MPPKPVLAVWVGADQKISDFLSGAGIPNYPTEDDAVRGFMHLVRHREVVEALAQVPPAMPSEFAPDIDAARRIVAAALADGRHWLDPVEIKRLFDAYEIAMRADIRGRRCRRGGRPCERAVCAWRDRRAQDHVARHRA